MNTEQAINKDMSTMTVMTGQHCESSAIMNALAKQGVMLREEAIIGWGSAPDFHFDAAQPFPFMGCRSHRMVENFTDTTGYRYRMHHPTTKQQAHEEVKAQLQSGTPVVLRVNMRYLPYLHGGKYGSKHTSFGWHYVCLLAMDDDRQLAWVTDTHLPKPQAIRYKDLAWARAAKEGIFPTDNVYYVFDDPSSVTVDEGIALRASLVALIDQYASPDHGLAHLALLPDALAHLTDKRPGPMIAPLLYTFYGAIEDFGTGGAGFRQLYHQYIQGLPERYHTPPWILFSDALDAACIAWHALAKQCNDLSKAWMRLRRNDRPSRLDQLAMAAQQVVDQEKRVYETAQMLYHQMDENNKEAVHG